MHGNKVTGYCSTWVCDHHFPKQGKKGRRWERKCGFGWGLGDMEQVGVDLNRLQGGKTTDNRGQVEESGGRGGTCCLFRLRMSPCPISFPLSLFFFQLSLCPCCSTLIHRQHFPSPFYQCHKSNLPLLQWITVFQQTQQSSARVLPS